MNNNELAQNLSITDLAEIIKIKQQNKKKESDELFDVVLHLMDRLGKDHTLKIEATLEYHRIYNQHKKLLKAQSELEDLLQEKGA